MAAGGLWERGLSRARREWLRWRSRRYWASVKGRYAGRRGFVIGNGPSLKAADLELLRDEVCIASNKIYLIYGQTSWRPQFHTMIDPLVLAKIGGTIQEHVPWTIVPEGFAHLVPRARKVTYPHIGGVTEPPRGEPLFSVDAGAGIFCGYTVTYDNLQLAVHLGLNPIYLLGCDHYYSGEGKVVANQAIRAGEVSNHFDPNYRQPGEVVNPAPIEIMTAAYEHARLFAERSGWVIRNATRGGYLEVFERTMLEEALGGGGSR